MTIVYIALTKRMERAAYKLICVALFVFSISMVNGQEKQIADTVKLKEAIKHFEKGRGEAQPNRQHKFLALVESIEEGGCTRRRVIVVAVL